MAEHTAAAAAAQRVVQQVLLISTYTMTAGGGGGTAHRLSAALRLAEFSMSLDRLGRWVFWQALGSRAQAPPLAAAGAALQGQRRRNVCSCRVRRQGEFFSGSTGCSRK